MKKKLLLSTIAAGILGATGSVPALAVSLTSLVPEASLDQPPAEITVYVYESGDSSEPIATQSYLPDEWQAEEHVNGVSYSVDFAGIESHPLTGLWYQAMVDDAFVGKRDIIRTSDPSSDGLVISTTNTSDSAEDGPRALGLHRGNFVSDTGLGLAGSTIVTTNRAAANGIALWAINTSATNSDATAVLSHTGTGPLLKGFGANGGEDEFRFDNDGTLHFFAPGFVETIRIDAEESNNTADGGQITLYNGAGVVTIEIDGDFNGDGRVTTQELQITGGSDLSEQFDINSSLSKVEPGMLVSIDPLNPGKLVLSQQAYDRKVAGIVSGAGGIKPGMMMGQKDTIASGDYPVALSGRVYAWVDTSKGKVKPGDLLTTSDVPGYAMKVTDHSQATGAVIGKAMTPMNEDKGLVLVLVSLQ